MLDQQAVAQAGCGQHGRGAPDAWSSAAMMAAPAGKSRARPGEMP
jgi:hypothetical protein